jgi:hypothetical protein
LIALLTRTTRRPNDVAARLAEVAVAGGDQLGQRIETSLTEDFAAPTFSLCFGPTGAITPERSERHALLATPPAGSTNSAQAYQASSQSRSSSAKPCRQTSGSSTSSPHRASNWAGEPVPVASSIAT